MRVKIEFVLDKVQMSRKVQISPLSLTFAKPTFIQWAVLHHSPFICTNGSKSGNGEKGWNSFYLIILR